jgi:hypothetical protein
MLVMFSRLAEFMKLKILSEPRHGVPTSKEGGKEGRDGEGAWHAQCSCTLRVFERRTFFGS